MTHKTNKTGDETMNGTRNLTEEYRKRTIESKKETETLISNEMRYSADLRKIEYLKSLNSHLEKLNNILETGKY